MGIDDGQEARVMAGGVPNDDPAWGQVAAFLDTVESAYPDVPTAPLEATHLAAVAREVRLVRGGLPLDRRKTMKDLLTFRTHRLLVGSIAAGLMLSAGVGVASAMGVGPLQHLLPAAPASVDPTPEPTHAVPTASAEPTDDASDDPAGDEDNGEQDDRTPKATPTSSHSSEAGDDDSDGQKAHDSKHDGDDENADDDQGDDGDDQGDDSGDDLGDGHHKGGDDNKGDQGDQGDNGGHDQGDD